MGLLLLALFVTYFGVPDCEESDKKREAKGEEKGVVQVNSSSLSA